MNVDSDDPRFNIDLSNYTKKDCGYQVFEKSLEKRSLEISE